MKLVTCLLLIFTIIFQITGQNKTDESTYLEDQLYLGVSYNLLLNKPSKVAQNGFSGSFSLGFIKDIPINTKRNRAFAIGLGYTYNTYIQNIKITKENNSLFLEVPTTAYNSNKFLTHGIEIPLEFRWRNSDEENYKFWRIYAGGKLSYLINNKTKFSDSSGIIKFKNIDEIEKLQYGLTLSIGYSTWNIYTYYGLNKLFKDTVELDSKSLELTDFKIGLIFYIL